MGLVPTYLCDYKLCQFCQTPIQKIIPLSGTYYYSCYICDELTKWDFNTQPSTAKKPIGVIGGLVIMPLGNHTIKDAPSILNYGPAPEYANPKTVAHYPHKFGAAIHNLIQEQMPTAMPSGEIELDGAYLFKEKKSSAIHRPYTNRSQWLFGPRKRDSSDFTVPPVQKRDMANSHPLILKHIEINSIIYTDCFSVYVNNRAAPKIPHLEKYGYTHPHANHKIEFAPPIFSDAHTNPIESLWKELKAYLGGVHSTDEFMLAIPRCPPTKNFSKDGQFKILMGQLQMPLA